MNTFKIVHGISVYIISLFSDYFGGITVSSELSSSLTEGVPSNLNSTEAFSIPALSGVVSN